MPTLDVTKVLTDPRFTETFTLIRRNRTVEKGRGVVAEERLRLLGVIQPAPSSKIERLNHGDWREGGISVWVKQFRFNLNTEANLPDEVVFENNRYVVIDVKDWSHYGRGFMEITALLAQNDGEFGYDQEDITP